MTLTCERKARNYSLECLSQVLNISPQVLHSIEKGKAGLNAERAKKIAHFFNKPIEYFFVPTYYRVRK
ncbi:helix-turn-helix domain-containing protein [Bacillus pseudomycoides]|uniref:XRE family transcriptional regulator n=1 Tax=Bacillus pseudomycoides TaxID=64104 RepID=A0ABD6T5U6_9BACI|nr:helix-turn-helix transcriptional regulator [Bacillus pseudomycoides]KFN13909.1 helix-turn-helix family protein [Bacillus pseudomycoides]MDR4188585.1 helix-turn-helix transcriptional regulator [Bacillus pseudomycoides]MED0857779.1 helix-turn-helix transcriptional regulator [Bacillus pseudomycoides]MED1625281.1 helix-turn-helix transcriptional regulator [Bacillus pseudomycoides]MED4654529.1 helix-turn-helix transcriptional regulator [Bacillus pseudomycoides]